MSDPNEKEALLASSGHPCCWALAFVPRCRLLSRKALLVFAMAVIYVIVVSTFMSLVEDWPVVDGIYFAVVTFTTVGYGDLTPSTKEGKLATVVFAIVGIVVIFAGISMVLSHVLERQEEFVVSLVTGKDTIPERRSRHAKLAQALFTSGITLFYILGGAFYWSHVQEGWDFIDGFYFTVVSVTTIGYGDMVVLSDSDRLFNIFFVIFGVIVLAFSLGQLSEHFLESMEAQKENRWTRKRMSVENFGRLDQDGDSKISKSEFILGMLVDMEYVDQSVVDEIGERFEQLDVDHDHTLNCDEFVHGGS